MPRNLFSRNNQAAWDIDATRPVIGWPREGHVQYDAYSTRYRPGLDLVLRDINCDIKQGEKARAPIRLIYNLKHYAYIIINNSVKHYISLICY
jgi:hypothetical protein